MGVISIVAARQAHAHALATRPRVRLPAPLAARQVAGGDCHQGVGVIAHQGPVAGPSVADVLSKNLPGSRVEARVQRSEDVTGQGRVLNAVAVRATCAAWRGMRLMGRSRETGSHTVIVSMLLACLLFPNTLASRRF